METLVIIIAVLVVFSLQLLLCLKVRNFLLKLLPAIITTIVSTYFFIMLKSTTSWDALGYAFLWILSLIIGASIIVSWIIWILVKIIKTIYYKRRM